MEIGSPKAKAEAIESLAKATGVRVELAEKARKHVQETFDISVMYKAYETIYDNLMRK